MNPAIVCIGLLAAPSADAPAAPAEVARAYEEARARAGRSPAEQVRLALWCEARGLTRERLNHLALAALSDPANATARGLMGLVAFEGRFLRPEAVADRARANPDLAEYDERRSKAPYTADGQWALGIWAEGHGLEDQARAHFTAVTRLDPARDAAWMRLGYARHGGRWATDAQVAAEKAEALARKRADGRWRPILEKHRDALRDKDQGKRAEAEAALVDVTDPRAVRSVWSVFAAGAAPGQALAVRLLGQIEGVPASRALAELAIRAGTPEVRRAATETLARRDPREFVGPLVGLVRKPLNYQVRPSDGPGSPGVLFIEGERYNLRRLYVQPRLPADARLPRLFTDEVPFDPWGGQAASLLAPGVPDARTPDAAGRVANLPLPRPGPPNSADRLLLDATAVAARRDARIGRALQVGQAQALLVQRQLAADIEEVEATNATIRADNVRVLAVLKAVTGKDLGEDPGAWERWRSDQAGYAYREPSGEKPTFDRVVFIPGLIPSHSCFGAGTMVRTIDGPRAIESLRAGDRVLAQDVRTGSLAFRPVLTTYHNPPAPTLRVRLGEDAVVATPIHRFWKAGKGWVMARDLRPGDPVRTLGGVATVEGVEEDRAQPVFNLEVAEGHTFLVGQLGALVHDNSLVEPATSPFDIPAPAAPGPPAR